jgi:surface polysaccharide O-acyltransferase-like enzyme
MILVIYLFVPFLGKGLRKLSLTMISNLLLLWILLTFACNSLPMNMYSWAGDYPGKLLGYFLYSGYLVLGYYLSRIVFRSQNLRYTASAIYLLTVAISAVCTYFFSRGIHKPDLSMYSYLSANTIIQSVAVFIGLKDLNIKNRYLYRIQTTMSSYSYGIYLVHVMVIGLLFQEGIYWSFAHPLISIPLLTAMVLSCSCAIIFLLRKIPFGKYVAG